MSTANRGKYAEASVKKQLASINRVDFAWWRLPDAHAGSMQPTLADFLIVKGGFITLLEVKEVAHAFRLPTGNFKPENRARMRMFQAAGAKCKVLVYFSTVKEWRYADLEYFGTQTTGSWDMRDLPVINLKEILC